MTKTAPASQTNPSQRPEFVRIFSKTKPEKGQNHRAIEHSSIRQQPAGATSASKPKTRKMR